MKHYILLLYLLCTSSLLQKLIAQTVPLIEMKLIPENPIVNTELKLFCHSIFPTSSSSLWKHTLTTQGNNIDLKLYYSVGGATVVSECKDTIALGILQAGNYQLIAKVYETIFDVTDIDTLNFTVNYMLGFQHISTSNLFSIYPNPVMHDITINSSNNIVKIEMFTLDGRIVLSENNIQVPEFTLDFSAINPGVYLLILTDEKNIHQIKKMVKTVSN